MNFASISNVLTQPDNQEKTIDFFDTLADNWFLLMNSTLCRVLTNTKLNESNDGNLNHHLRDQEQHINRTINPNFCLTKFSEQFKALFTILKAQQLLPNEQRLLAQKATELSHYYADLLDGMTCIHMACLKPKLAQGRFDYGEEKKLRQQQLVDVANLYQFFNHFYGYLLTQQPKLPLFYPKDESLNLSA